MKCTLRVLAVSAVATAWLLLPQTASQFLGIVQAAQPLRASGGLRQLIQQAPLQNPQAGSGSGGTRVPQVHQSPGGGWVPGTGSTSQPFGTLSPLGSASSSQPSAGPGKPIYSAPLGGGWNPSGSGTGMSFGGIGGQPSQSNAAGYVPAGAYPPAYGGNTTFYGSNVSVPTNAPPAPPMATAAPTTSTSLPGPIPMTPSALSAVPQAKSISPLTISASLGKPAINELVTNGRAITDVEIRAADGFFKARFLQLLAELRPQLNAAPVDHQQLIAELNARSVSADAQLKILEALKGGNSEQAKVLLTSEIKDPARAEEISRQIGSPKLVEVLEARLAAGTLSAQDVEEAQKNLAGLHLPVDRQTAAAKSLADLQRQLTIAKAVASAVPSDPNKLSPLPTGVVSIILNPKLPECHAIALGNGYAMIGTGGRGELDLISDRVVHVTGLSVESSPSLPPASEAPVGQGVLLCNPSETRTPVYYKVENQEFQMEAGFQQVLPANAALVIDFHRGGDFGRKQYSLDPGTYHFGASSQGWELYAKSFDLVVDNRANARRFCYSVGDEPAVVEARSTAQHTSRYPIVIRFDRGNGSNVKQCKVGSGVVRVAVNAADNLWDLFAGEPEEAKSMPIVPAF